MHVLIFIEMGQKVHMSRQNNFEYKLLAEKTLTCVHTFCVMPFTMITKYARHYGHVK